MLMIVANVGARMSMLAFTSEVGSGSRTLDFAGHFRTKRCTPVVTNLFLIAYPLRPETIDRVPQHGDIELQTKHHSTLSKPGLESGNSFGQGYAEAFFQAQSGTTST